MSRIHLIWAQARNGVIGKDGVMPWHLPEDLAHFKRHTHGWPVIMGRKTWDSLPPRFRPLPGRQNIVITRQAQWSAPGATTAASLDAALASCAGSDEVWVIGGAQIYRQAEPLAERIEMTQIEQDFEGDAHAPALGADWQETAREDHTSTGGMAFSFITYRRQQPKSSP
ncbi:dihydrofolate reductase [Polaromonas sp. YR568]|uniref:dihydrofolate reductase n=1 Tax=Polaromonas sp. YR568 TaxID=1855301 RepID=UPI003137DC59